MGAASRGGAHFPFEFLAAHRKVTGSYLATFQPLAQFCHSSFVEGEAILYPEPFASPSNAGMMLFAA